MQRRASQHPAFCCPGVAADVVEGYCQLDPSSFFSGLTGVRALWDYVASWVAPSCLSPESCGKTQLPNLQALQDVWWT